MSIQLPIITQYNMGFLFFSTGSRK